MPHARERCGTRRGRARRPRVTGDQAAATHPRAARIAGPSPEVVAFVGRRSGAPPRDSRSAPPVCARGRPAFAGPAARSRARPPPVPRPPAPGRWPDRRRSTRADRPAPGSVLSVTRRGRRGALACRQRPTHDAKPGTREEDASHETAVRRAGPSRRSDRTDRRRLRPSFARAGPVPLRNVGPRGVGVPPAMGEGIVGPPGFCPAPVPSTDRLCVSRIVAFGPEVIHFAASVPPKRVAVAGRNPEPTRKMFTSVLRCERTPLARRIRALGGMAHRRTEPGGTTSRLSVDGSARRGATPNERCGASERTGGTP